MRAEEISGGGPVLVRYRHRAIGPADIARSRRTIAAGEFRGRVGLSQRLCRTWNWRQAHGALSEYACPDLLLRLEQLPP